MPDLSSFKKKIDNSASLSKVPLDELIDYAEEFVKKKDLKKVKTHQIRRFFDAIKNIKEDVKNSGKFGDGERAKLLMLRPQLANASAKQYRLKELTNLCTAMIKKVAGKEDFDRFVNFFESLVAFHKAYAEDK